MVLEAVRCPVCHGIHVNKYGKTEDGKQRYICRNKTCSGKTFIREYSELGRLPDVRTHFVIGGVGMSERLMREWLYYEHNLSFHSLARLYH